MGHVRSKSEGLVAQNRRGQDNIPYMNMHCNELGYRLWWAKPLPLCNEQVSKPVLVKPESAKGVTYSNCVADLIRFVGNTA